MPKATAGGLLALVLALLILGVSSIPYYLQARAVEPDRLSTGILLNVEDQNTYLAWARQARDGKTHWVDQFTSEPQSPAYFNSLWWLTGRLAAVTGASLEAAYQAERLVFAALCLALLYAFLGQFLADVGYRLLAFWLIAAGGGLGWIPRLTQALIGLTFHVPQKEFITPDIWMYLSLAVHPHFALALALLILTFHSLLRAFQADSVGWAVVGGAAVLALATFHIYELVTIGAVAVVFTVAATRLGLVPGRVGRHTAIIVGAGVPFAVWLAATFRASPVLSEWARQNNLRSLPPMVYALAMGAPVILACWRCENLFHWRQKALPELLLSAWLLMGTLLVFGAHIIPFEARLIMGLQIPLVIIAVQGLQQLAAGWRPSSRVLAVAGLIAAGLPSTVLVTFDLCRDRSCWISRDMREACRYLETQAPPGNVLCSMYTGVWIPRFAGRGVYLGHCALTANSAVKTAAVKAFFDPATSPSGRERILREGNCTLVCAEGAEVSVLDRAPPGEFRELFRNGSVLIFATAGAGR